MMDARGDAIRGAVPEQRTDDFGDSIRIQFASGREQWSAMRIGLTHDDGARGERIQRVAKMQFEKTALLFDHQNRSEPLRELAGEFLIERERHSELGDS